MHSVGRMHDGVDVLLNVFSAMSFMDSMHGTASIPLQKNLLSLQSDVGAVLNMLQRPGKG